MNKPHKHAEVIKAWADGADVQFLNRARREWVDIDRGNPVWDYDLEYRIKPQPKDNIVFICKDKDLNGTVHEVQYIYSGETGELISSRVLL